MYLIVPTNRPGRVPVAFAVVADSLNTLALIKNSGRFNGAEWYACECYKVEGEGLVKQSTDFHKQYIWNQLTIPLALS